MRYCDICHGEMNDDARFCPMCGVAVTRETRPAPGVLPPPVSGSAPPAPPPASEPAERVVFIYPAIAGWLMALVMLFLLAAPFLFFSES